MLLNNIIKENEILGGCTEKISFEEITADRENYTSNSLLFVIDRINENTEAPLILTRPPCAVIISKNRKIKVDCPVIRVENARRALAYAYSRMYGINYSKLKVIGITGTNGKTTTATILYKILRHASYKVGLIGTGRIIINDEEHQEEGYSMTTPDPKMLYSTLKRMQEAGCEYVVSEVSSHALALEKVAPIKFVLGVFTNLSKEHSDFHCSMEEYYGTKKRLFSACSSAVINIDDGYARRLYEEIDCKKISVGALYQGEVKATDILFKGLSGNEFIYKSKGPMFRVRLKLIGSFNIYNAMLALASAIELGVRACIAKEAVEMLERIKGRMERISEKPTVFIDYAHTPFAFENSLISLKSTLKQGQKLTVVFGCGGNRDREKRKVMGNAAEKNADYIIVTEDNCRGEEFAEITKEILSGIKSKEKLKIIKERSEAIKAAVLVAKENDVILISGKGEERYIIDKDGTHPYSEYESVRIALEEREAQRR